MNLMDLGKEIAKYGAPLLGTVIGGPAGAAIGQIVASKFGGNIDDPQDLYKRLQDDPESHIKLREIEAAQSVHLQRLSVQQAENELKYSNENTANARASNIATGTVFPQIISIVVTLGFFGCIYWIAAYTQDHSDKDVLFTMLGGVAAAFQVVINYWLGSSADRSKK